MQPAVAEPAASEPERASDGASASPAASDAASPSAPAASPSAEPSPSRELRPAPMRLYAYEDRSGDRTVRRPRRRRLLTGGQLEKHGRPRAGAIRTWASATVIAIDELAAPRSNGDQAGRSSAGARLIDPRRGRPSPALTAIGPGKIVCVGLNYADHVAEGGRAAPDRPLLFAKFANAIVGDGEAIVRPPGTHALDLEVELGVVIGRPARRVTEDEAMDHVAGYVVVNDVSARDWQGNAAGAPRGREGRRPVAARQGQRHVPARSAPCS